MADFSYNSLHFGRMYTNYTGHYNGKYVWDSVFLTADCKIDIEYNYWQREQYISESDNNEGFFVGAIEYGTPQVSSYERFFIDAVEQRTF